MSLINNIKKRLGDFLLKRELRNIKRLKKVSSFDSATKIGIVYFFKEKDDFNTVVQFRDRLKEAGKNVKLLVYLENIDFSKLLPQVITIDYIGDGDLNFYFKPISGVALDFVKDEFDILIDLNIEGLQQLKYITSLSAASFKVGLFNNTTLNPLDLMIKLDKNYSLELLIKEIDTYLRMIKSKSD